MAAGLGTWKELISCDIGKVQRLSMLESTDSWEGIRRKDTHSSPSHVCGSLTKSKHQSQTRWSRIQHPPHKGGEMEA